jgi:hypothetical protein
MPKRFQIVLANPDGGVAVYPMKEWLRSHPQEVPPGLHPTNSTSHELRNGLKKGGWSLEETETQVRLIPPGDERIKQLIGAVLDEEPYASEARAETDSDAGPAFGLEYQLRDFLAQNLNAIVLGGEKLRLFVDATGRDGIEYPTAVGPIDILAVDSKGGFVVFELKRARSPDHAVGQLTRYMGWIKETIGKGQQVRGVIVAREIGAKLRYAVSVIPNTKLFEYEVQSTLRPAELPAVS